MKQKMTYLVIGTLSVCRICTICLCVGTCKVRYNCNTHKKRMHVYVAGVLFLEIINSFNSLHSITHQSVRLCQVVVEEEVNLMISKGRKDFGFETC
jgi:hypothetical protein